MMDFTITEKSPIYNEVTFQDSFALLTFYFVTFVIVSAKVNFMNDENLHLSANWKTKLTLTTKIPFPFVILIIVIIIDNGDLGLQVN